MEFSERRCLWHSREDKGEGRLKVYLALVGDYGEAEEEIQRMSCHYW